MENNELILIENNEEVKYKVILDITGLDNKNYIVYTKDKKNCFVSTYKYTKTGKITIKEVKTDKEYDMINDILNSLQNKGE